MSRKAKNINEFSGNDLISINDGVTGEPRGILLSDLKDYISGKKKSAPAKDTSLNKMKIEELIEIAKELEIEDFESLKKAELIESIEAVQKEKK